MHIHTPSANIDQTRHKPRYVIYINVTDLIKQTYKVNKWLTR